MEKSLKNARMASKAILTTAVVMAIQMLPMNSYGQVLSKAKGINSQPTNKAQNIFIKYDIKDKRMSIVGFLNSSPVYKNDRGEYFTINAKNGDLSFVSSEEFAKFVCCFIKIPGIAANQAKAEPLQEKLSYIKFGGDDIQDVQIIALDKEGRTIHKNKRGETFYVDTITGDFVFVKM